MAKKFAVRNIRLCTKECLCLYVCPTGATDTEDSIIDTTKCIGCGKCVHACVSGAISLIPTEFPPQQVHEKAVLEKLDSLFASKVEQEHIASGLPGKLGKALEKSNRIMAEDICRESGYMLPQSRQARKFLKGLVAEDKTKAAEILLSMIQPNE